MMEMLSHHCTSFAADVNAPLWVQHTGPTRKWEGNEEEVRARRKPKHTENGKEMGRIVTNFA